MSKFCVDTPSDGSYLTLEYRPDDESGVHPNRRTFQVRWGRAGDLTVVIIPLSNESGPGLSAELAPMEARLLRDWLVEHVK